MYKPAVDVIHTIGPPPLFTICINATLEPEHTILLTIFNSHKFTSSGLPLITPIEFTLKMPSFKSSGY